MKFSNLKTKPKILMGICSPMVLLLILGGISVYNINTIVDTNKRVSHTHEVLGQAADIVGSAVDMETGMRGYLLAGKENSWRPTRAANMPPISGSRRSRNSSTITPNRLTAWPRWKKILREWQSKVTEPTITLRRNIGNAKTINDITALVGEARGKKFFDKFRGQIGTFINREATLLKKRRAEFQTAQTSVGTNFKLVNGTIVSMAA